VVAVLRRRALPAVPVTGSPRSLLVGQEEERRQLASGIHDDTVQAAVAASLRLQRLRRHLAEGGAADAGGGVDERAVRLLDDVDADLSAAIERLRRMVFELHPPTLDEEGLESAICLYLGETVQPSGLRWSVAFEGPEPADRAVRVLAYRLFREAVSNTVRHANATALEVVVRSDDGELELCVADDGVGFDPALAARNTPGHLGLRGSADLTEAAGGTWELETAPGQGTRVVHVIPQVMD
jgi:signal transduction histidine kinase